MVEKLNPVDRKRMRGEYMCDDDFPHVYSISLGEYKCTRKCRMCPMYTTPPEKNVQITDEIMKLALAPVGSREVSLEVSAYGEPFTHPSCDEYMFLSRKMAPNAEILFVTNGSMFNEERSEKIVDSGIDVIQVSLDAGSSETYKWLTGSNAYDHMCRGLENLAEIKEKRGGKHLKIQTHIIGIKELEHEFDGFVDKWSKIVDQAVVREYGNWGGRTDYNGVTPAKEEALPDVRYPCAWLWYATKIEPDGSVVKCHMHVTRDAENPEILGNILDEPFEDIWRGEKARAAREAHLSNNYDQLQYCNNCNVWSLFYDVWDKEKMFGLIPTGKWK